MHLRRAALVDWLHLSMVLCLALLLVHTEPPGLPRACLAPLLTYAALVAASTVWRRRACAAVSPAADPASAPLPASSYLRWHQLLLVALRFGWAGCEAAIDWLRRRLLDPREVLSMPAAAAAVASSGLGAGAALGPAALAHHCLVLLAASSALCLAVQTLRPLRISLAIPVQLGLVLAFGRRTADVCAAGALAAPRARALTRRAYDALHSLSYLCPLPLSIFTTPDAAAECATVLRFLQACLGLLLPLAWQLVQEGRLFAAHARQRRAARLPPERGVSAWIHAAGLDLAQDSTRPYLYLFAVMLLGCAWDWSAFISAAESAPPAAS